ncbi:hypothetical protein GQ55_6G235300 [Panicum hallii var. hallii]|uniref:Uncharacterized protein n=1 Tax=Panicum hallii var. hallii TaxID=1504633 RepID=A0A2T7D8X1_9POAL|nr:hypothetical protein GQ55_6G235300 [Panicum hallii var. hallii]
MRRAPKERRSLSPSLANRATALANRAWPSANRALFRESSSTAGESSSPPANRARLRATRVSGEGGEAASAPPPNRARLPATRAPAREARRRAGRETSKRRGWRWSMGAVCGTGRGETRAAGSQQDAITENGRSIGYHGGLSVLDMIFNKEVPYINHCICR